MPQEHLVPKACLE